jgi:hypothetical protein
MVGVHETVDVHSHHFPFADRTRHIVLNALSTIMENPKSLEVGFLWSIAPVLEAMTGKSEVHFLVTTGEFKKRCTDYL